MPKGHFERSEEHKRAISGALKGKPKSAEHTRKNAESHIGKKQTAEWVEKLRQRMLQNNPMRGRITSDETKAKQSAAKKGTTPLLRKYGVDPQEYARQIAVGNRWCCHRKHFSSADGFPKRVNVCGECKSEYYRASDLRRKYGITHEWYLGKLAEQDGVCGICKTARLNAGDKHFHVDHDHKTGEVRGLLCGGCNTVLGYVETIPNWILAVAGYLARYTKPAG